MGPPDLRSGRDAIPDTSDPPSHGWLSRRAFLPVVAGGSALWLAYCSLQGPAFTLRYALKIVITAGGREYSGRSVIHINWIDNGWLAGFDAVPKFTARTTAEAVVLDLGSAGLVFGLIWPPESMPGFNASRPGETLRRYLPADVIARADQDAVAG